MEFKNFAELVQSLGKYDKQGLNDPRLTKDSHGKIDIKQTGQCEVTDTDGGYLVSGQILTPIARSIAQKATIFAKATKFYTSTGKGVNSAWLPYLSETARTYADNQFKCYWVEEGESKTEAKFQFGLHQKKLNKLFAVISVTEELFADSIALQQSIEQWIASPKNGSLLWFIEYAMLYGNFATSMEGIFSAGATGVVGVATADPLDEATLRGYVAALSKPTMETSEWYMSNENFNDVMAINFTDDTVLKFENGKMYLYGMKVNVMEQMVTPNDIVLGDFSQYAVALREGPLVESAISIHLKFLTDEKTLRMGIRINGCSFGSVFTLQDSTEVGTFVIPEGSPAVESSSSSSGGHSSSSSSSRSSASSGSTASSASSSSRSSNSSSSSESSDSSTSESSTSSSESQEGACSEYYCGSDFSITELNGQYRMSGTYNSKPAYKHSSGIIWMWYDTTSGYWVLSNNKGDPQNQWASATDTAVACPDGDVWVDDDGVITAGYC
jgi:HK97 family phage major capsid protein